jgi:hypothetical protein
LHTNRCDDEYINADLVERIGVRHDDETSPVTAILRNGESVSWTTGQILIR